MRLAAAFLVALLCSCCTARGDGGYVPRTDYSSINRDVREPTQKAILIHCDGQERLILQVTFQGDVSEFVWLVPIPARPQVRLFNYPAFHELGLFTAPKVKYWLMADELLDPACLTAGILARAGSGGGKTAPTVDVLERKQVGVYDVAVLNAAKADDLISWLRSNHYRVDRKIESVLSDYIRRGWYFTAARIDTRPGKAQAALREGTLHALQFDFASRQPIYPLKISSINPGKTKVLLYVCAVHRMTHKSMETVCVRPEHYVPYIAMGEGSEDLGWRLDDKARMEGLYGWRCTKLTGEFSPKQMTRDLVLTRAKDDESFRAAEVSPPFYENLGAVLAALLLVPFAFPFNVATGITCYGVSRDGTRSCRILRGIAAYCVCSWIVSPVVGVFVLEPMADKVGYWPVTPVVVTVVAAVWLVKARRWRKLRQLHG